MERERILRALAIGAGAVLALLIGIGPIVYVYFHGFAGIKPSSVDGETEWKERAEKQAVEKRETEKKIQDLGLDRRYSIHPFIEELRIGLYEVKYFDGLDAQLASEFQKTADPYQAYLYSLKISELVKIDLDDDPVQMLAVLDEWVNNRPKSYYARLLRAKFHYQYSWYFRGRSHISNISTKSRKEFEHQCSLAKEDLYAARALNKLDPEVHTAFIETLTTQGGGRDDIERLYQDALEMQPLWYSVHEARMVAAYPRWRGSWQELDRFLAQLKARRERFPLLGILQERAEEQMQDRSPAHKAVLDTPEKKLEWAEPYLAELNLQPGDPLLMTQAIYYLIAGRDFSKAELMCRRLGNNYYEVPDGAFRNVFSYNGYRGFVYAAVANERMDKPDRRSRAEEALAIAPNHAYTMYVYGELLYNEGDLTAAIPYFEKSREINSDYIPNSLRLTQIDDKLGRKEAALRGAQELLHADLSEKEKAQVQAIIDRNR